MIIRITNTLILFLISITIMSAQKDVKDDFQYNNLSKYLNEAIELIEEGDFKMGAKKLKYAQKSMDKLIKKGYEPDLQFEREQIKVCQNKLANPESDFALPSSNNRNDYIDLRHSVHKLVKQVAMIKDIFESNDATVSNVERRFVTNFNHKDFLKKCQELKLHKDLDEPKYKRQAKELQQVEDFVNNITANAEAAKVFDTVDDAIDRMKKYPVNVEILQEGTTDFIRVLMKFMPRNNQLENQLNQVKNIVSTTRQNKVVASAAAEAEQRKKENAKAAAATAAAKAENALPVAGLRDASLEAEFKRLGQTAIGNSFRIEKIIITASKWGVTKDAVGRAISRSMITAAIGKDGSGQCYKQFMTFTQNASGGSYGKTFYDSSWSYSKKKINCQ